MVIKDSVCYGRWVQVWRFCRFGNLGRDVSLAVVSLVATAWAGRPDAPVLGAQGGAPGTCPRGGAALRGSTWQAGRGGSGGDGQAEYAAVAE